MALFAFLAAVYLSVEATDELLRKDFRRRALFAAGAVAIMAFTVFVLSETGAPRIRARLLRSWWSLPLQLGTAVVALGSWYAIWKNRFRLARQFAVAQVTFIVWGWGLAQYPYLVVPALTTTEAAAPQQTLELLVAALAVGAIGLLPAFFYLFRVFKGPLLR